jgi:hypothetical protein
LLTEWVALMQQDALDAGLAQKSATPAQDGRRDNDRPVATIPTLEELKNPNRKRPAESMDAPTRAPSPDKSIPSIPKLNPLATPSLQNDPFDPTEFNRRYHPNGKN